ncbi:MAG: hypothetical protein IJD60_09860 [Clostridia bacterium]|nr:hypothetical protein [Clostridia bacterium]
MSKKTIFSVVLWLAALVCCLLLADCAMRRDDGRRKYGAFFEEKNDFDVLFMGTSRVLDGISPMELWRDHGYTSYNMGVSSECMEMTEWVLKLSLGYNRPKVAMIDVYYIDRNIDDWWAYSYRHMFLDELPLSREKIECVKATLPQKEWQEFLMPFSLYHGRWEEILAGKTERIVDCEPYMMGSEFRAGRMGPNWDYVRTQEMNTENMPGKDALRRIVTLCRENGIMPVFMMLPAPISLEEQRNVNSVALIAKEMDVPFINMMDMQVVDFETDMYDYLGHMNPDGATKITAYLGQWLSENADLADKRGDSGCAHWDENLKKYEEHRARVWGGMTML